MASARKHSSREASAEAHRIGPYELREEIGRGSFATVYYGEKLTTSPPTPVAIKLVVRSKLTAKLLDNLESEIRMLTNLRHGNIVELVECLKTDTHIYIVMAFCASGDLSQYIKRRGLSASIARNYPSPVAPLNERFPNPKEGGLHEVIVRSFIGQLSSAIRFMRAQNIMHRDIKPQNLLLQPADPTGPTAGIPTLRVADFGFARFLPQASMAETLCGSPLYMAPEILGYHKYDAKADLWSIGAVIFEIATGRPPFRAANHVELLRKIEKSEDRVRFPDELGVAPVPADIRHLICGLLKRNAVERLSFEDFFTEADVVSASGAAKGIWPPPALPQVAAARIPTPTRTSPLSSPITADPPRASPPPHLCQPSSEGAFLPSRPSSQATRRSSFAPKYVVGTSATTSGTTTPPMDIATGGSGIKTRDYAAGHPMPAATARRMSIERRERDTPPELIPASSLEENSPMAPITPRSISAASGGARVSRPPLPPVVTEDDSVLGREYVVVEKRTVEINALADELNSKRPVLPSSTSRRNSRGFLTRPPSGASTALVSTGSTPYPPPADFSSTPPFAITKSRPSPPLRPPMLPYSSSRSPLAAPQAAIARAISLASLKIFGNPSQGILLRRASTRKPISRSSEILDPAEDGILNELEDLAQKASVIFDFADSRLLQVLPPTPSMASGAAVPTPSSLGRVNPFNVSPVAGQSSSSPSTVAHIAPSPDILAAEAFVLYLKALAFLQRGIEKARLFWEAKDAAGRSATSNDFNDAVQWLRTRFNECFEKADFAKSRCREEMPESAAFAEKLVYDRALEMSRAAAVNELMGESATDCEIAYETALWMLYAILDETMSDGEPVKDEDRVTVEKFIGSIRGRLNALQRKMRGR